jgi:hypothetical protein
VPSADAVSAVTPGSLFSTAMRVRAENMVN